MDNVFEQNHCGIEFTNVELALKEPKMMAEMLRRCAQWVEDRTVIEIAINPRKESGWLEGSILVHRHSGGRMYIAVIQRKPDAEFEFHS